VSRQTWTLTSPIEGASFVWLDKLAAPLQAGVHKVFRANEAGRQAKNWLNGVPLRHRVHPALVAIPIGAWTTAALLDALDAVSPGHGYGKGADAAILFGAASAAPTVAAGLADWVDTYDQQRRVGMAHALANSTALALYGASLLLRRDEESRGRARILSLLGFGAVGLGGMLGGELVYNLGVNVNYLLHPKPPLEYVDVAASADATEGKPIVVETGRVPVLLLRREGRVYAVEAWCPHAGGPLVEGTIEGLTVECPWHQSCFRLDDGRAINGPATSPLRTFDVREQDGRIAVQPSDEARMWPPPTATATSAP